MYTDVSGISFSLAGGGLPGSSVSTEQLNAALSRKSTTTARRETSVQSAAQRGAPSPSPRDRLPLRFALSQGASRNCFDVL